MFLAIVPVAALLVSLVSIGWTQGPPANPGNGNGVSQSDLAAAKNGDTQAQLRVGKAYYNGPNRQKNYHEAVKWFKAASSQGSQEATAWLGMMMVHGRGVHKDYDQGIGLIKQAASANDPVGLRFAGVLMQKAVGDNVQAASLFDQAAKLHDANSMAWLGRMYLTGQGVPRDKAKAISLFTEGSQLGDQWSQLALSRILLQKDQYDPTRAAQLLTSSAAQGNAVAALRLGLMLQSGKDVPQDLTTAARYLRQSAGAGYAPGERALGRTFELGIGVPTNQVYAYIWYSLASQQGDSVAADNLAKLAGTMSSADLQKAQTSLGKWNATIYVPEQ